jgi:hypothetical protein
MFYPHDPAKLRSMVRGLLEQPPAGRKHRHPMGLLVPHAGYQYSGLTAAYGYAQLKGEKYTTVVIVSPSHREYFDGVSVYPGDAYATPLGEVVIDTGLRDLLVSWSPLVTARMNGHHQEHAVEVQIPFLQETLDAFMVIPLVVGDQSRETCLALGDVLAGVCRGRNVLLVASTDLSHFHQGDVANRLDAVVVKDVEMFDYEKLMTDIETGQAEACGGGPAVAVMCASRRLGATSMEVLHHCNSGDITGDRSSVVGYLSAAAYA